MKKILSVIIVMTILMTMSCSSVPVGNVGVKVYLLGGQKGVDSEVLKTGRYWIGWNEDLFLFPTFQQNKSWTASIIEDSPVDESFTFQTSDAMSINCDVGISYSFDPEKITKIFEKYRKGPEEITNVVLRREVRNAFNTIASKYPIEQIASSGKITLLKEVKDSLVSKFKPEGILINEIGFISDLRFPQSIVDAINLKNKAKQLAEQRENEIRQTEAEAAKNIAEAKGDSTAKVIRALGEAKANFELSRSITPNLIGYIEANRWNGSKATTVLSSEVQPIINTK